MTLIPWIRSIIRFFLLMLIWSVSITGGVYGLLQQPPDQADRLVFWLLMLLALLCVIGAVWAFWLIRQPRHAEPTITIQLTLDQLPDQVTEQQVQVWLQARLSGHSLPVNHPTADDSPVSGFTIRRINPQ